MNIKKGVSILAVSLVAGLGLTAFASSNNYSKVVQVKMDEKVLQFDDPPQIVNGRVLVPLRNIGEKLNASFQFEPTSNKVILKKENTVIEIPIGKKFAIKNGKSIALDSEAKIIKGRTLVPLRFISENLDVRVQWDAENKVVNLSTLPALPTLGNVENLKSLMTKYNTNMQLKYKGIDFVRDGSVQKEKMSDTGNSKDEFSKTNVQVNGVDEGDIVKTDGKFIYQVNQDKVIIIQAYPVHDIKVFKKIDYKGTNFTPSELYVDDKHLIVIGSYYEEVKNGTEGKSIQSDVMVKSNKMAILPYIQGKSMTKMIVYNIEDKENISKIREVDVEGNYLSSRKIENSLYMISNKNLPFYMINQPHFDESILKPSYKDSIENGEYKSIDFSDIKYFPNNYEPNYLLVSGLNLDDLNQPVHISTYMGSGNKVYASQNHLYVAVSKYDYKEDMQKLKIEDYIPPVSSTMIYKFKLEDGKATFYSNGEIPGTVLNQFSMDEYNNMFRVATTSGEAWRTDEYTSKNNVYILDENLITVGKLENLAPGERIYSTRFIGNKSYIVTFKTVDPLFVIDLSDARNPQMVGALKIPGYSDYLHPYDENHVIGFGKETIEVDQKDFNGNVIGKIALYQGMKMALFDVSDALHPIEKFKQTIGDRGTDSELLFNHKSLFFEKDRNLLAFPITVREVKNNDQKSEFPQYGELTFQGTYIYSIDNEKGFELKKKISHLSSEDYKSLETNYIDINNKSIDRILYIKDNLYTISKKILQVHGLENFEKIGEFNLD